MKTIGENLCEVMDEKGVRAKDLALASGWSEESIYRWRKDDIVPNAIALHDIAVALGVGIERMYR